MLTPSSAALAATVALAGCYIVDPPPKPDRQAVMTITPNLDLLFVIDDSGTMVDKQGALQRALPALLDELATIDGGLPNLHVGVASTDMGTLGSSDDTAGPPIGTIGQGGCGGAGKAGALQRGQAALDGDDVFAVIDRDGHRNFTTAIADTLGALTSIGSQGCGFEQPLHAMRSALADDNPANTGFLRDGANLAVVVLTDEDDCSVEHAALFGPDGGPLGPLSSFRCFQFGVECDEPVDTLGVKTNCRAAGSGELVETVDRSAAFLDGLAGPTRRVTFAAIVGDDAPIAVEDRPVGGQPQLAVGHSCSFLPVDVPVTAFADPAVRFTSLAETLAAPAVIESICSPDLAPQLQRIGAGIAGELDARCIPVPVSECIVEDREPGTDEVVEVLSTCDGGVGGNCFRIVDDPTCNGPRRRLEIEHPVPGASARYSTLSCIVH